MDERRKALSNLIEQVRRTRQDEIACDETFQLLDRFAEALAAGEDAARLMPLVQQHLDMCPDCREEFEALLRVLESHLA